MNKLIKCVVIMVMIMIPVNVMARMYPSQITIPSICFTDPRELYTYQELILGETLVAVAKTLKTARPEDQGWVVIFYGKEKDSWSLAGIVAKEACIMIVGHGWDTIPFENLPPFYEEHKENPKIPQPEVPEAGNNDGVLDGKL